MILFLMQVEGHTRLVRCSGWETATEEILRWAAGRTSRLAEINEALALQCHKGLTVETGR